MALIKDVKEELASKLPKVLPGIEAWVDEFDDVKARYYPASLDGIPEYVKYGPTLIIYNLSGSGIISKINRIRRYNIKLRKWEFNEGLGGDVFVFGYPHKPVQIVRSLDIPRYLELGKIYNTKYRSKKISAQEVADTVINSFLPCFKSYVEHGQFGLNQTCETCPHQFTCMALAT